MRAYTVNAEHDIARPAALGVDGIITDAPDRLRAVLSGARSTAAA